MGVNQILEEFPGSLLLTLVGKTNGALLPANAHDVDRNRFYREIVGYAGIITVLGPLLAWAVFVLPGWL